MTHQPENQCDVCEKPRCKGLSHCNANRGKAFFDYCHGCPAPWQERFDDTFGRSNKISAFGWQIKDFIAQVVAETEASAKKRTWGKAEKCTCGAAEEVLNSRD